jgi:DNA-binding ferritin-like protein
MRKAIATSIRNAVNHVQKLAREQDAQLNAISSATDLNDQERDEQVQSALDKLQQALDKSIIDMDEDEDEDYEEELNFIED